MYYYIEPEVSGGLGDKTIIDTSVHPPVVTKLHIQFDDWLGDDLIECFPCFIITKSLARKVIHEKLTGYELDYVEISKSDEFKEFNTNKGLPDFLWFKVTGKAEKDDFWIAEDKRLAVTERALRLLKTKNLKEADIEAG